MAKFLEARASDNSGYVKMINPFRTPFAAIFWNEVLLNAMKSWVDQRKSDSAGADPQQVDDFAKWVEQRQTIHRQTSSTSSSSSSVRSW